LASTEKSPRIALRIGSVEIERSIPVKTPIVALRMSVEPRNLPLKKSKVSSPIMRGNALSTLGSFVKQRTNSDIAYKTSLRQRTMCPELVIASK
jgi:hypothetical protein